MADDEPIPLIVDRKDDLLTLTLNRPNAANALSPALVEAVIDAFEEPDGIRLCAIRGEGRHFCAGFDLSDLDSLSDGDLLWRVLRIETMLQTVHHAPFPVVALAQGQVVGAGADLFAACWRRVAVPEAKFRMPGWNFELALGTRRLTALIGPDAARDMLIDTKVLPADEALKVGLATAVADRADWPEIVETLRKRAQALPARGLNDMFAITATDTRDADLAAVVRTASKPGLKERIAAYRRKALAK